MSKATIAWEIGKLIVIGLAGVGAATLITLAALAWRLR